MPCPCQTRLDGADCDAERVGDFFVTETVDSREHDHRALIERQAVERRPEALGQLFPGVGTIGRGVIAGLPEIAVRRHVLVKRHLVGLVPPPPPALLVARLVDADAVDPGFEGRLAAEVPNGAEDAEKDFLGEVARFVPITEKMQRQLVDHPFVARNELRAGRRLPRGTALNEHRLTVSDLCPPECPSVFHDGFGDCSNAHGQCIKLEPVAAGKFPPSLRFRAKARDLSYGGQALRNRPEFATLLPSGAVRGTVIAFLFVAVAGVAGALGFSALTNEREFDRLIANGDQAVADERPFQAIEAYSGAIARNPDSMLAHLKRGSVYHSQNQLDAALRDLRRATELDPSALRAIEMLGDVNVGLGRADRAIEAVSEAFVSLDERNARVLYKLGLARYRDGRVQTRRSNR